MPELSWEQAVESRIWEMRALGEAKRRLAAAEFVPPPPELWASLDQQMLQPPPPDEWLAEGLWRRGHRVLAVALFKAGKTRLVANAVAALADKQPLLGFAAVNGPVRKIAAWNLEMDQHDFNGYLALTGNKHLVIPAHLRQHPQAILTSEAAWCWARDWLRWTGAEVWLVDTWGRLCAASGVDPLDNGAVGQMTACLDQLMAESGVRELLLTSHTPKAARSDPLQETALGAQALSGWADTIWTLWEDTETHTRFFRALGRRVDLPECTIEFDPVTGRMTAVAGGRETAGVTAAMRKVLEVLTANDLLEGAGRVPMRKAMVRQLAGLRTEAVDEALRRLVKDGVVTGAASAPGAPADYRIVPGALTAFTA